MSKVDVANAKAQLPDAEVESRTDGVDQGKFAEPTLITLAIVLTPVLLAGIAAAIGPHLATRDRKVEFELERPDGSKVRYKFSERTLEKGSADPEFLEALRQNGIEPEELLKKLQVGGENEPSR
ncbi:MAG: hypothetical protein KC619_14185 [Myxococcales bacterium]|nr:hypothetical protein [Myxococcales bacterium]